MATLKILLEVMKIWWGWTPLPTLRKPALAASALLLLALTSTYSLLPSIHRF